MLPDPCSGRAIAAFLLTNEVARILGVSADTVRLWERLGRLPAVKTSQGVRLFDRRDVEDLVRARLSADRLERESAEGERLGNS